MKLDELIKEIQDLKEKERQLEYLKKDKKKMADKLLEYELKDLLNKAYEMGNDSKISLYLRIMDILDYYDENITIERKMQIKKEYGIGDDK